MENTNKPKLFEEERKFIEVTKNGFTFIFKDGDDEIRLLASANTGLETVFFNDEEISKVRSLKFSSRHIFEKNGHDYEMIIITTHVLRGGMDVLLLKDKELIGRESKLILESYTWKKHLKILFFIFLIGAVTGFSFAAIEKNFF